ncbi:MAG: hypothetical protein ABIU87_06285 [Ornithinibacter sp.]
MADTTQDKGRNSWWIPAATFLVGLVLGGGVIAATTSGGDTVAGGDTSSSPSTGASTGPTGSPSPSGPADAVVTVPGECLQVAEDSQKVLDLVNDAVAAVRDLDASALSDVVRKIQSSQEALSQQTTACRDSVEAPVVP